MDSTYRQYRLNRQTDKQADRVLLLEQVIEKEENAHPSHFLKYLFASRTNGTFGFAQHTSQPFAKPNESFLAFAPTEDSVYIKTIFTDIN